MAPGAPPLPSTVRICPASLGVRCAGDVEHDIAPMIIISKGGILPAQGTATVRVSPSEGKDGTAKFAVIEVVEVSEEDGGEVDAATSSTRVLGTLTFDEVPEGEGSVEVTVGLTLRSEGILKVEAIETATKAARGLVIGHE